LTQLEDMCSEARAQGPKQCAVCIGQNPEHVKAAQRAGCVQDDIDAWCQTPHNNQVVEGFVDGEASPPWTRPS
jgi:hypothetical protein